MQKRSHKLLASTLLKNQHGFAARRFELAFLFGSFQPDCNPLTYLKGSLRAYKFRGHNYSNSSHYIAAHIARLLHRIVVLCTRCLQRRIVVNLSPHALLQFVEGHLQHPHHQHLLLCEPLLLHLLLCLYQFLPLRHGQIT